MLGIWVTQGTQLMISMQELRFPSVAQEQKYGTRGQQVLLEHVALNFIWFFRAPVLLIDKATECEHKIVMKDLCCDCGADLRK